MIKKLKKRWKHLNFSRQIAIVYIAIVAVLVTSIVTFSGQYLSKVVENKIMEFFENALHQSSMNISTMLQGYKSSFNQVIVDPVFLDMVDKFDGSKEETEDQEPRIEFRNTVKTFLTYQSQSRCMSLQTESGKIFSFDRLEVDSIYQKPILLHRNLLEKLQTSEDGKRVQEWMNTEFLDRQGTKDYYVFTLKAPLYNWYDNRYAGTALLSIDECVLSEISKEAQISDSNEMFIVNEEEQIISHTNSDYIGTRAEDLYRGDNKIVRRDQIEGTNWQLISILDRNYIFEQLQNFYLLLLLLAAAAGVLAITLIVYVSKQLSRSVKNIVTTMETVQEGEMSAKISVDTEDRNEITKIAARFNSMMNKINEQVEQIKEAGKKEKNAEIKALEAQINPHFIYNTLDSINWMAIENKEDEISEMLSEFAQILRYQINKSTKLVSIKEEISYLEMYLHLQKVRFSDTFEYMIHCDVQISECVIHKMLFQPFVENAIVHSFANLNHGGFLKVIAEEAEQNQICFIVSDNGMGMSQELIDKLFYKKEALGASIGIPNVLARLRVYYGEDYHLEVESREEEGTVIKIWIPKMYEQADRGED